MPDGHTGTAEANERGATPDPKLSGGVVFDGATEARLAEAPIYELATSTGDRVLATTHHGFGYKQSNEDRIAMVETRARSQTRACFFVVDGMGGHHGGDLCAQALCEELILASRIETDELAARSREMLVEKVLALVSRLPRQELVDRIVASVDSKIRVNRRDATIAEIHREIVEIVQVESIQISEPEPEDLQKIAEVVHHLMRLSLPDRTELAVRNTKLRVDKLGYREKPPDACFVGAVIRTREDGRRTLDVKQVGDCKLVVRNRDGVIRFQSIGESVIAQPDLRRTDLTLAELMTYSLHRNFVSNSMNMTPLNTKRYRKSEVPLDLAPGDVVCLYSDGCDDILSPEELVGMERGLEPPEFVRSLLRWSENRMRFVNTLLRVEQAKRRPGEIRKAYPAVHRVMNEQRLNAGRYVESYPDGSSASWVKPPKCDNFAFCMIRIGGE